jgi:hypothetical protein
MELLTQIFSLITAKGIPATEGDMCHVFTASQQLQYTVWYSCQLRKTIQMGDYVVTAC